MKKKVDQNVKCVQRLKKLEKMSAVAKSKVVSIYVVPEG